MSEAFDEYEIRAYMLGMEPYVVLRVAFNSDDPDDYSVKVSMGGGVTADQLSVFLRGVADQFDEDAADVEGHPMTDHHEGETQTERVEDAALTITPDLTEYDRALRGLETARALMRMNFGPAVRAAQDFDRAWQQVAEIEQRGEEGDAG